MKNNTKQTKDLHTYMVGVNILGLPIYRTHVIFGEADKKGNKKITNVIELTHH